MNPNDPQFGQQPLPGQQPAPQGQGGIPPMTQPMQQPVDVYGSAHVASPQPAVPQEPAMQPPADSSFGAFGSLPAQPQQDPQSFGNASQAGMPGSTVTQQPNTAASQTTIAPPLLLTPDDEADLFGKEKLSLATKLLIVGAVVAALASVVAVGLWLYSTYIKTPNTGSTPNGAPAANANKAAATQDADTDGLTDADEKKYGSDPKKADTDGDGFSDSAEVKNGYNPAGPGKLQ